MANEELTLDGHLSADGNYLMIAPEIRFRLDPRFYENHEFGKLGLMPDDISFYEDNSGIPQSITEHIGKERYGNLDLQSREGDIGSVVLSFVCGINRRENRYILRHCKYKKDDLFVLYLQDGDSAARIGIGTVNVDEEYVAKLMGFGIKDEMQKGGHGTALLAAIENEYSKTNLFLLVHEPLKQSIPYYVQRGYRYLEHPNGPDFAKVLNPGFDERLLMPRE